MATETVVPFSPAAAGAAAPVSAPAAAPAAAPASAPAPSSAAPIAPAMPTGRQATKVDPAKFPGREDYARELLKEKLSQIAQPEEPAVAEVPPAMPTGRQAAPETEPVGIPEVPEPPVAETAVPAAQETAETPFELEPEPIVTPEVLGKLAVENPEFGKLLEADSRLKGQLYKTAREAAELKPYREIFPDLDSAKMAQEATATWNDVRDTFMGSTTRDGTIATLARMAELSYERDADGNVLMENGQPVIGEDFYGFVDHVVGLDLEHRDAEITERLASHRYATQEDLDRDQMLKAALDVLRGKIVDTPAEPLPEAVVRRQQELDRREQALNERQQGERVSGRRTFEQSLQEEAKRRIGDGVNSILSNVEKQGAVISPYLKTILPRAIASKLVEKIQANPTLQGQMRELQRLPIGDNSRTRRLAAIDRAVQQYLPEVARAELREAGVQAARSSAAKQAKVEAQAERTRQSEPKGATGPATGAPMDASAAFSAAQAEWQRANPGRPFDKVAREMILPRVLQLMTQR